MGCDGKICLSVSSWVESSWYVRMFLQFWMFSWTIVLLMGNVRWMMGNIRKCRMFNNGAPKDRTGTLVFKISWQSDTTCVRWTKTPNCNCRCRFIECQLNGVFQSYRGGAVSLSLNDLSWAGPLKIRFKIAMMLWYFELALFSKAATVNQQLV